MFIWDKKDIFLVNEVIKVKEVFGFINNLVLFFNVFVWLGNVFWDWFIVWWIKEVFICKWLFFVDIMSFFVILCEWVIVFIKVIFCENIVKEYEKEEFWDKVDVFGFMFWEFLLMVVFVFVKWIEKELFRVWGVFNEKSICGFCIVEFLVEVEYVMLEFFEEVIMF